MRPGLCPGGPITGAVAEGVLHSEVSQTNRLRRNPLSMDSAANQQASPHPPYLPCARRPREGPQLRLREASGLGLPAIGRSSSYWSHTWGRTATALGETSLAPLTHVPCRPQVLSHVLKGQDGRTYVNLFSTSEQRWRNFHDDWDSDTGNGTTRWQGVLVGRDRALRGVGGPGGHPS